MWLYGKGYYSIKLQEALYAVILSKAKNPCAKSFPNQIHRFSEE